MVALTVSQSAIKSSDVHPGHPISLENTRMAKAVTTAQGPQSWPETSHKGITREHNGSENNIRQSVQECRNLGLDFEGNENSLPINKSQENNGDVQSKTDQIPESGKADLEKLSKERTLSEKQAIEDFNESSQNDQTTSGQMEGFDEEESSGQTHQVAAHGANQDKRNCEGKQSRKRIAEQTNRRFSKVTSRRKVSATFNNGLTALKSSEKSLKSVDPNVIKDYDEEENSMENSQHPFEFTSEALLEGIPVDNRSCRSLMQDFPSSEGLAEEANDCLSQTSREMNFDDKGVRLSLLSASDLPEHHLTMYPVAGLKNDRGNFGAWQPRSHIPASCSKRLERFQTQDSSVTQQPGVYDRLQSLDRHRWFRFEHYPEEPRRYMEEYRSVHTVGKVGHWARRQYVIGTDVPDAYVRLARRKTYIPNPEKAQQPEFIQGQQVKQHSYIEDWGLQQRQQQQQQQQQCEDEEEDLPSSSSREFPVLAPVRLIGKIQQKKRFGTLGAYNEIQGEQLRQTVFLPPLQGSELRLAAPSTNNILQRREITASTSIINRLASENVYIADSSYFVSPPAPIFKDVTPHYSKSRKNVWKNPVHANRNGLGFSDDHQLALSLYRTSQMRRQNENGKLTSSSRTLFENDESDAKVDKDNPVTESASFQRFVVRDVNRFSHLSRLSSGQHDTSASFHQRKKRILLRENNKMKVELELTSCEPCHELAREYSNMAVCDDVMSCTQRERLSSFSIHSEDGALAVVASPACFDTVSERYSANMNTSLREQTQSRLSEPLLASQKTHRVSPEPIGKQTSKSINVKDQNSMDLPLKIVASAFTQKALDTTGPTEVNENKKESDPVLHLDLEKSPVLSKSNSNKQKSPKIKQGKIKPKVNSSLDQSTDHGNSDTPLVTPRNTGVGGTLHQSYPVDEWKRLVDTGECGFIVRSFPSDSEHVQISQITEGSVQPLPENDLHRSGTMINTTILEGLRRQGTSNKGPVEHPEFEIRNTAVTHSEKISENQFHQKAEEETSNVKEDEKVTSEEGKTPFSVRVVSIQIPNKHQSNPDGSYVSNFKMSKKFEAGFQRHRKPTLSDEDLFIDSRKPVLKSAFHKFDEADNDKESTTDSHLSQLQTLKKNSDPSLVNQRKDLDPSVGTQRMPARRLLSQRQVEVVGKSVSSSNDTQGGKCGEKKGTMLEIDGQKPFTSNARIL